MKKIFDGGQGRLLVAFLVLAILARTKLIGRLDNEIPARAAVDRQ